MKFFPLNYSLNDQVDKLPSVWAKMVSIGSILLSSTRFPLPNFCEFCRFLERERTFTLHIHTFLRIFSVATVVLLICTCSTGVNYFSGILPHYSVFSLKFFSISPCETPIAISADDRGKCSTGSFYHHILKLSYFIWD